MLSGANAFEINDIQEAETENLPQRTFDNFEFDMSAVRA